MTQNKSQEPVSDEIASIIACRDMLDAQPVPPQRTEQNFCSRCGKRTEDLTTIHTCTPPQPAKPIPCANHCEAKAFEIVIKNLRGEIERLKASQRTWVGLTEDDKVLIKHDANFNQFMTAGEYADKVQQLTEARLKDKNT